MSGTTQSSQYEEKLEETNPAGYAFALIAFLYEVMVCLVYAFFSGYDSDLKNQFQPGDILFVSVLSLLAIIGFGLINSYITNSAFSGISMSLLIFALTLQHYFLFRTFWYKVGVYSIDAEHTFDVSTRWRTITYANVGEDLQSSYNLPVSSVTDAIACSISLMIAFSSVVGRVGLIQTFTLTVFGTLFYEVNSQLLWRFFITDTGYCLKVFLFGSVLGFLSSFILGKKQTTVDHEKLFSRYTTQAFGLIGFCFIFCAMPFLTLGGLYRTSANDSSILWMAALNIWLSLVSGVLGSFSACAVGYAKIFLHDLIFSGLGGAIAYSSSCDLHRNPAVPLTVGFLVSFLLTFIIAYSNKNINNDGVIISLSIVNRFLIPACLGAITTAALQAISQTEILDGNNNVIFSTNRHPDRTAFEQGGYQLIGFLLSFGIPLVGGLIVGLLYKLTNKYTYIEQFNDNQVFGMEGTGKKFISDP